MRGLASLAFLAALLAPPPPASAAPATQQAELVELALCESVLRRDVSARLTEAPSAAFDGRAAALWRLTERYGAIEAALFASMDRTTAAAVVEAYGPEAFGAPSFVEASPRTQIAWRFRCLGHGANAVLPGETALR